jgi:phage shock protein A
MSVWSKIITAVKGHANEAGEAIVDANLMTILDQELREAKVDLDNARDEQSKMLGHAKLQDKKVQDLQTEVERMEAGALKALNANDEALAREAAERIDKLQGMLKQEQALADQYRGQSDRMRAAIQKAQTRVESLEYNIRTAKAEAATQAAMTAASTAATGVDSKLGSAMDSLDRLKKRQAEKAAMLEAAEERERVESGSDLNARLAKLDGGGADDILAKLRAKQSA